ncbi:MAG: NADH-quinone oxidoreductase subunit C [Deltaproteobacteria bacterium]|jgi:NADH-quinone oxidoreductase subunit C|nr:NADH-quinone oxidoreductase subunit C [Deltaproteobacteria bacterium]
MLLARIKEALSSLYEDIQEIQEAPEAAEAAEEVETAAADAAPAEDAQPEESPAEQKESDSEEASEEAEEPPAPPGPRETDYKTKGYHLDAALPPEKVVAAAEILSQQGFFIEAITGVDWIDEQQLEVVYDFNHFDELCRVVIRSRLDRNEPEIPTISHIYQGANWHERETHDFFGIIFTGHPNLEPLLLPEDADFHPLLKDFKA